MTYESDAELPACLRAALPAQAQALYRAAYNRVFEQRRATAALAPAGEAPAEAAHRAGLLAVSREFEQTDDGRWRRAPVAEKMQKPRAH